MTLASKAERAILSKDEQNIVALTHYPALCDTDDKTLSEARQQLRAFQDKERTFVRQMNRSIRGKAEERGGSFPGNVEKPARRKQAFSGALKRLNKELTRRRQRESRAALKSNVEKALEMKALAKATKQPSPGKTADTGVVPVENPKAKTTINRDKVGSISQRTKNAQARNDRLIQD